MNENLSIIAAVQRKDRAIGKENKLPWHIREDLQRFKRLTLGHAVIMGRKTYESIGKPLPGRLNVVISRNKNYEAEGCTIVTSLAEAIEKAETNKTGEIFVLGGGEIYAQALGLVSKLHLTVVDADIEGDAFFPDYSDFKTVVSEEKHLENNPPYSFVELKR